VWVSERERVTMAYFLENRIVSNDRSLVCFGNFLDFETSLHLRKSTFFVNQKIKTPNAICFGNICIVSYC
jgi:hypothetical protein